jgi:uncharacterized membrane protein HdeD (DUF308 family)
MNNLSFFDLARHRYRAALAEVDQKWGWYLALGIFLILLGIIASGMAVWTTLLTVKALGFIMVLAGGGLTVMSFLTGKWSGFLLSLAGGALLIMTGIAMLSSPVSGAAAITLVVATILMGAGIYRSISAVVMRFPYWGWSLVSGFVSILLGYLLLRNWATASLFFLGVYVGLDLIVHGFSWAMFSLRVHSLAGEVEASEPGRRAA